MRSRRALSVAAALAVCLAIPAATSADPVIGGRSVLNPDPEALETLAAMDINTRSTGRAVIGANGVRFPIVGGDVTVHDAVRALIKHTGGLEFRRHDDGARVKFSKLSVSIVEDRLKVFAKSGGERVRFFDIAPTEISGSDSSMRMEDAKLTLAQESAEIFTETFGAGFEKGDPVGRLTVEAEIKSSGDDA